MKLGLPTTICLTTLMFACAGKGESSDKKPDAKQLKSASAEKTVEIYTSAKARQCEFKGHTPIVTAKPLQDANIPFSAAKCGQITGMMRMAMCGASTNDINIYTISEAHLEKAKALGFASLEDLVDDTKGTGYEYTNCVREEDKGAAS